MCCGLAYKIPQRRRPRLVEVRLKRNENDHFPSARPAVGLRASPQGGRVRVHACLAERGISRSARALRFGRLWPSGRAWQGKWCRIRETPSRPASCRTELFPLGGRRMAAEVKASAGLAADAGRAVERPKRGKRVFNVPSRGSFSEFRRYSAFGGVLPPSLKNYKSVKLEVACEDRLGGCVSELARARLVCVMSFMHVCHFLKIKNWLAGSGCFLGVS